jgi:hypothetical protein
VLDADVSLENEPGFLFDALVLPDGQAAVNRLMENGRVLEHIKDQHRHCKAILVLGASAGSRRRRPARSYSAFAPVSLITLPQRGISLRIQLPNCSGVLATTSNSISCSRCVISGERMIFTSSRL